MINPIPVVLITGFLGSGKTTFINHILQINSDKKISLILNEFGDIKLESQFIEVKGMGMVSELSGGCLCCVASVDLPRVVRYTLEKAPETEYLIIEASGLSDPDPVRATLTSPMLSDIIRLDTVVAIVDADNFETTATSHPLVMSQIAEADYAILAKVENHSKDDVKVLLQRITSIGLGTKTFVWDSSFDSSIIFDPPLQSNRLSLNHHHIHTNYETYWYTSEKMIDINHLREVLNALPDNILRVKGNITDMNESYLIQKVGNHVDIKQSLDNDITHKCVILVIGTNLSKNSLNTSFGECVYK